VSFPATPGRPDLARPRALRVPPRADVPGRPDAPARRDGRARTRRPWIAVAIVSALALFAGIGAAIREGSRAAPSAGPGAALASPDQGYTFLETRTQSGERLPVRWNPCEPIEYEVNLRGAPSNALDEVRRATDRVTDAAGISFVFDGTTDRSLTGTRRDYFFSDAINDTYYPVLVTWIPHQRMVTLTKERDVLAFAHPEPGGSETFDQWVSGWIVVDTGGRFEPLGRYSLELVLMHGLGHVAEPDEMMFSQDLAPHTQPEQMFDWGPGDLAGLELLGHDQGCMDHVDVAP
jgi:hypothetical protein